MKLQKLQIALKNAQMAQKAAKTAYEKIITRTRLISEAWSDTKAKYKAARKELKRMRRESALTQAARKAAKHCYKQSNAALEKLARKLKKSQKKSAAKAKTKVTTSPGTKTNKGKLTPRKKRGAPSAKAVSRSAVTVPIHAATENFPEPAAAQA